LASGTKAEIGQRLRELRGNESQADFARRLKADKNTIGNYERGDRSPDLDFLIRLKEVTGVSLDWLATGEGEARISEPLNAEALRAIISAIEQETTDISVDTKVKLILRLYRDRIKVSQPAGATRSKKQSAG
jgi:transcriptional regulator with XRE-family HTH domain